MHFGVVLVHNPGYVLVRPLNRTLVAQRITVPQMWIGGLVALQHVGANYFFIYTLGCGYLGTAYASVWSIILATLLVMAYIRAANLQDRVWGKPDRAVWKVRRTNLLSGTSVVLQNSMCFDGKL